MIVQTIPLRSVRAALQLNAMRRRADRARWAVFANAIMPRLVHVSGRSA